MGSIDLERPDVKPVHLGPSNAVVGNARNYVSTSPIFFQGVMLRHGKIYILHLYM